MRLPFDARGHSGIVFEKISPVRPFNIVRRCQTASSDGRVRKPCQQSVPWRSLFVNAQIFIERKYCQYSVLIIPSLLHNYRGSGGRGKSLGSATVQTPELTGARGVSTDLGVAECRRWWPVGRRPRMAGRAVPSGAASAASGAAAAGGVRW